MASVLPTLPQCSQNQATAFLDTTTVTTPAAAMDAATASFSKASDYILDNSISYLLQGQRPSVFFEV